MSFPGSPGGWIPWIAGERLQIAQLDHSGSSQILEARPDIWEGGVHTCGDLSQWGQARDRMESANRCKEASSRQESESTDLLNKIFCSVLGSVKLADEPEPALNLTKRGRNWR